MKKNLLIVASMATVGLGLGVPAVMATTASAQSNNNSSIVDKLSSKFNLNKNDVQKVFDEERASHMADREKAFTDRLATLVKDGKITQAQADKITAKHSEMKANMEAMKDKTREERHKAMEQKRADLQKWAKDNGIDEKYVMGGGPEAGGPGNRGGGRGMHSDKQ